MIMWHEIKNQAEADAFMESIWGFHDSCIKEMSYVSGAYVDDAFAMYPINDQRVLRVLFQRQFEDLSVMEIVFSGLNLLRLSPVNEEYTCEILDATLLVQNGCVYWCDCGGITEEGILTYDGTVICAEKVCWRPIEGHLGKEPFYLPADGGWGDTVD